MATQPVLPLQVTLTQSLPEGPPDQQVYEPPLLFLVQGVVVQGTLVSGSPMVAIAVEDVLAVVRMVNRWPSFIQTPALSAAEAAEFMETTRPAAATLTPAIRTYFLARLMAYLLVQCEPLVR